MSDDLEKSNDTGTKTAEAEHAAAPDAAAVEIAELKDRLLRTLAEMENLRQRTRRDVDEAQKYAVTGFARDLLEIADNLRRALESAPRGEAPSEPIRNLLTGVAMTEQALLATLEKHRIRKVTPERGERFDHKVHQAMFELPTAELPAGTVAEVLAPGYIIADRLLRAAMVGVAKAPPEPAPAHAGETPQGGPVDSPA